MEDKLKILFAYFRAFKTESLETYMNLIYDSIEDWDKEFTTSNGKNVKILSSITKILEEIVYDNMTSFHRYNDYDESDCWTLYVNIYPQENRINFKSECEIVTETEKSYEYDLTSSREMSRTNDKPTLPQQTLGEIDKTFKSEVDEEDKIVSYSFDGYDSEIYVDEIYVDEIKYDARKQPWVDLLDKIMREIFNRWWTEGLGMYGTIIINRAKNTLNIDLNERDKDPKMTKMDLNITPDSY